MKFNAIALVLPFFFVAGCNSESAPAPTVPASQPTTIPAPPPLPTPAAPKISGRSYILVEFASGQTLAAQNEDARVEPASLTKIMTAYAVFDALRSGSLKLTDTVTISEHAWRSGGAVAGSAGCSAVAVIAE